MTPSEALERHAAMMVNIEHHGREMLGTQWSWEDAVSVENSVREGHTTLVNTPICQVLEIAQRGYPDGGLVEKDMPFSNGFAWLEHPFDIGLPNPVGALSWLLTYHTRSVGVPAIALVPWVFVPGTRFMGFADSVAPKLVRWPFGERWSALPLDVQPVARYFASLCMFMQQKILVASSIMAERHARKRLARQGFPHEPLIRVVELRRREPINKREAQENEDELEWSCQWIVRGHWRQQFYPSKHGTQPIWITPYVKGPPDKPLKPPRATVFAVVR
jgi:hypothetical protein